MRPVSGGISDETSGDTVDMVDESSILYSAAGPDVREFTILGLRINSFESGDVDRNGLLEESDAVLTARLEHGLETLTPEQLELADVNADGKVDVLDALIIRKQLKGYLP